MLHNGAVTDHDDQGLTLARIRSAEERLAGIAHRTPVLTSATLDAEVDGTVLLKAEMFQRGGAFKFRGAYSRMTLLDLAERDRGVVAYSSGNHGGAVALAARLMGIPAVVVVPRPGPRPSSPPSPATAPSCTPTTRPPSSARRWPRPSPPSAT